MNYQEPEHYYLDHYYMVDVEPLQSAWCSLCSKLHQTNKTSQTIDLMKILDKNNCKLPPYIEMEVDNCGSKYKHSTIILLLALLLSNYCDK